MQYVDTVKDRPGGSDARFWKQYLSEDEGEPVFGFSGAAQSTVAEDDQPQPKSDKPAVADLSE